MLGFEIADRYRNPAMILGDGILGQMMEPVIMREEQPYDPAPKESWALGNSAGRERHMITSVRLAPGTLEIHNMKLMNKYQEIEQEEVRYELSQVDDADVVIVAYGTSARIAKSAVSLARRMGQIKLGLIRPITIWPFPTKVVSEVAKDRQNILVVEMSLGQMYEDVLLSVQGKAKVSLLARTGGGLPTEEQILEAAGRCLASGEEIKVFPDVKNL
jgi:2-oxoglutarate ferredoxin oxidoreductase subunit alpha